MKVSLHESSSLNYGWCKWQYNRYLQKNVTSPNQLYVSYYYYYFTPQHVGYVPSCDNQVCSSNVYLIL